MNSTPRCRKCGEKIGFAPRPGFVVKGDPKYIPVNADDRQPHWRRCRENLEGKAKVRPRADIDG